MTATEPETATAVDLRAGQLTALLSGIDVDHIAIDGVEIVRRVYVAVRDEGWDTIPARVTDVRADLDDDSFTVTFFARHVTDDLDFSWQGRIEGTARGELTYAMRGTAGRSFRYGRIGLCILHDAETHKGRTYRTDAAGGSLPVEVFGQRLVDGVYVPAAGPFSELELDLSGGTTARFAFEGDEFEMEDQRNWTDATFKTYSTPLSRGLDHQATAGTTLNQRVTITAQTGAARKRRPPRQATIELLEATSRPWPSIGSRCVDVPTGPAAAAIRALGLQHHRIDVDLSDFDPAQLARAAGAATAAGAAVELAVTATDENAQRAGQALAAVSAVGTVVRVLVFDRDGEVSSPVAVAAARSAAADAPVGGGTDLWFAELNRNDPVPGLDVVSFSITPQFHLADDESLFETLPVQALVAQQAGALYPGIPLVISPVTLSMRDCFAVRADALEPSDPRQSSLLCAAWTAGSIAHLTGTPVGSITYFELTGPRGLVPAAGDANGLVHPVYHVLFDARAHPAGTVLGTTSSSPDCVVAAGSSTPDHAEISVVNLTPTPRRVSLGPFASGDRVTTRVLDSVTLEAAVSRPDRFRAATQQATVNRGAVELDLGAYAVCTVRHERK